MTFSFSTKEPVTLRHHEPFASLDASLIWMDQSSNHKDDPSHHIDPQNTVGRALAPYLLAAASFSFL